MLVIRCHNVWEQTFTIIVVHVQELVQRHHVVVPGMLWRTLELFQEAAFGQRKVCEGKWQFHGLLVAFFVLILNRLSQPVVVQFRVAFQRRAIFVAGACIRIVTEQWVSTGINRQPGLVASHVIADTMLYRAGRVDVEQSRTTAVQTINETFQQVRGVAGRRLQDKAGAVSHADQADLLRTIPESTCLIPITLISG